MEAKDYVLGLGVLATLIVGIYNAITNFRISRRTIYINTVTAERVKWLSTLRENISTFCGLTYTWQFSELTGKPEEQEALSKIDKLKYLIRLQLNPEGKHDKIIEEIISSIPSLAIPTEYTTEQKKYKLKEILNKLIIVSQLLLKEEWEKVKEEVKHGDLKEPKHCLALIFKKHNSNCLEVTSKWQEKKVESSIDAQNE